MMKTEPVVGVVGLGYVGMPIALAFGRKFRTIGFDLNSRRVAELKEFRDSTGEVPSGEIQAAARFEPTTDDSRLKEADIVVVCVPTPVEKNNRPDFGPLVSASRSVGRNLKKGAIVVYESTVYPGATEEICVPELERHSGLKWKTDFFVGYSPERINPGDKVHTLEKIKKVVAGDTSATLETLAAFYGSIITAGIHPAESIKVAEAAKIIENTQRDLNIALINECAMIFHKLGIDTQAVLDAAGTKWNFLPFRPGLVGGHCIGVDPYYLTEKAQMVGYHPKVILAGRSTNDGMGKYVAEQIIKGLIHAGVGIKGATVNILGLTFKENVSDIRNSKVVDVYRELLDYGVRCALHDFNASANEAMHEYGIDLTPWEKLPRADAVLVAVSHKEYLAMGVDGVLSKLAPKGLFCDLKSIFSKTDLEQREIAYWRL